MQISLTHLSGVVVKMRKGTHDCYHLTVELEGLHDVTVILSKKAWDELFTQYSVLLMHDMYRQMEAADANG